MLIKKVDSIADIPSEPFECYGCNEEIEVGPSDIEIIYALEDDCVFIEGQQDGLDLSARAVVPEDSMETIFLAGNVNEDLEEVRDVRCNFGCNLILFWRFYRCCDLLRI